MGNLECPPQDWPHGGQFWGEIFWWCFSSKMWTKTRNEAFLSEILWTDWDGEVPVLWKYHNFICHWKESNVILVKQPSILKRNWMFTLKVLTRSCLLLKRKVALYLIVNSSWLQLMCRGMRKGFLSKNVHHCLLQWGHLLQHLRTASEVWRRRQVLWYLEQRTWIGHVWKIIPEWKWSDSIRSIFHLLTCKTRIFTRNEKNSKSQKHISNRNSGCWLRTYLVNTPSWKWLFNQDYFQEVNLFHLLGGVAWHWTT